MKQFDDIFKQQVNRAFENYNADHLADEAWKSFEKKKSNSRWLGLAIPLWAKAASIAILLSFAGILTYRSIDNSQIAELNNSITHEESEPITTPSTDTTHYQLLIEESNEETQEKVKTEPSVSTRIIQKNTVKGSEIKDKIAQRVENNMTDTFDVTIIEIDTTLAIEKNVVAEVTKESADSTANAIVVTPTNTLPLALSDPEPVSTKTKKTSFFAGLSGMIAQVENMISTSPGVSVGLYAEHKLSNRLSFRPGIALAKHTYGLESMSNENDFMYAAPTLNGATGEVVSYSTNLDIVAMEVPLNFVFTISERQKRNLFVSAGVSTMVYLSQRFTGNYQNVYTQEVYDSASGETSLESNYTNIEVENEYGAFSRVDYFGLANLSAGYSFPLGKSSTMLIEPFIQLPTHNLTSNNLRIRYGGLSLKYKFGE